MPVWGVQGHPEVDRAQALAWFEQSRPRLEADGAVIAELADTADDAAVRGYHAMRLRRHLPDVRIVTPAGRNSQ